MNKSISKQYIVPLILIFCLFFLWAISSNLLPTMIRQLMKTCELNPFQASFTESAYWLAYFIFPIPIVMFMKRFSYKDGIEFLFERTTVIQISIANLYLRDCTNDYLYKYIGVKSYP